MVETRISKTPNDRCYERLDYAQTFETKESFTDRFHDPISRGFDGDREIRQQSSAHDENWATIEKIEEICQCSAFAGSKHQEKMQILCQQTTSEEDPFCVLDL